MTTQTHSSNGTSAGHSDTSEAAARIESAMQTLGLDATGNLLDQAQAIVAAATARMDQSKATAKTERRKLEAATVARKELLTAIDDLDESHRVAKADLVRKKKEAAAKVEAAGEAAKEADKDAKAMKDLVARYGGMTKFITSERAPRNRSGQ